MYDMYILLDYIPALTGNGRWMMGATQKLEATQVSLADSFEFSVESTGDVVPNRREISTVHNVG
jgi:hypothetical protein